MVTKKKTFKKGKYMTYTTKRNNKNKKSYKRKKSHKRKKRIKGGGFIDNVKTKVSSLISNVTEYFKPKNAYSIESFEGNFNTLFD
jgi:hypothetical protein